MSKVVVGTPTIGTVPFLKNLIAPFVLHQAVTIWTMPLVTKVTGFQRTYDRHAVQQEGTNKVFVLGSGVPDLTKPIVFTVQHFGATEDALAVELATLQGYCEQTLHIARSGWYWRVSLLESNLDSFGGEGLNKSYTISFLRHFEFPTRSKVLTQADYNNATKGRFIGYRGATL